MARPRQVTNEQILSTTRQAVVEHGSAVSLDVVADRLGVTGPALLKRFGSREKLMVDALLPPETPAFFEVIERGPDTRTLEAQLQEIISAMAAFFSEMVPCMIALRQMTGGAEEVAKRWKVGPPLATVRHLKRWLNDAQTRGLVGTCDTETVATAILGAVSNKAFIAHLLQRPASAREQQHYASELAALFSRAVRPDDLPRSPRKRTVAH